jgi:SSS family solute:Na+ symporter
MTLAGIIITLAVFIGLSIYAGTRVKSAADFTTGGGKSSAYIVAGTIMGTLVGGSSTIGTAQLAYNYGLSAWWFTLGGGIAALILAFGFVKPFRRTGCTTLVGVVAGEYGRTTGLLASVASSVGIFVNIIAQLLSAIAVLVVIVPTVGTIPALILTAALMVIYVTLGGIKGAGMIGILKLVLLYVTVVFCAAAVLMLTGGLTPLLGKVGALNQNFGLFARGFGIDAGAGASLIFGVLTTQTYGQAIMAGKTDKAARRGALISTFMIPPVGICGILVGLYMRVQTPPDAAKAEMTKMAAKALTAFISQHVPDLLGGVMLATLLFAVVGTGAGLALGISTIISNDIRKLLSKKAPDPKKDLLFSRAVIIAVLAVAVAGAAVFSSIPIQVFAYISMGLRGAVMFMPLLLALYAKNRVKKSYIITSVVVSPLIVLVFVFWKVFTFDPLFLGLAFSLAVSILGLAAGRRKGDLPGK